MGNLHVSAWDGFNCLSINPVFRWIMWLPKLFFLWFICQSDLVCQSILCRLRWFLINILVSGQSVESWLHMGQSAIEDQSRCQLCFSLQGFWYFARSWSHEFQVNTRNPAKFARHLTKYMSAQHIWKLSWLLGLLTCCKLANLPWNFVTAASKQHPKTTRRS